MDNVTNKELNKNIGKRVIIDGNTSNGVIIGVVSTFPTWNEGKESINYVVELDESLSINNGAVIVTALLVHVSNVAIL